MSVVDVTKMWSRTGGVFSSERARPSDVEISFSEGYQVLVDDINDGPEIAKFANGVPQIGDRYQGNLALLGTNDVLVINSAAERLGPVFWMVVVQYKGRPPNARPEISWRSASTTEPIDVDIAGRAIVNVNGEPVEGLTKDISDAILVVKRRFEVFNPDIFLDYTESINSDVFLGRSPGSFRFMDFQAQNAFADDTEQVGHWMVTASFAYRRGYRVPQEQAWWKRYRNEGLYVAIEDGNTGLPSIVNGRKRIIRAVDSSNQPMTRPVLLDALGFQEFDETQAIFLTRNVYTPLPYSALGFF